MPEQDSSCIVSSVRLSHNPSESLYCMISEKVFNLKSAQQLELYDEAKPLAGNAELAKRASDGSRDMYALILDRLVGRAQIDANAKMISMNGKAYSQTASRMVAPMRQAAITLLKAYISGAPISVHFHNDGDGSAGAIALHRAFSELEKRLFENGRSVSWHMNKSIAYTAESFYVDRMLFESYSSAERPVVLITDFGTSPESVEAIRMSVGAADLIWIDHHMPYEGFPKGMIKHYINAFDFGGDSNFTAGLETCMFAEMLSGVDVEDLKGASLISDYSCYSNLDDQTARKNSVILDYLTSSGSDDNTRPKRMDMIIKDKERSEYVFRHAVSSMNEAINTGIKNIKSYRSGDGINVHVLDFGHIAKLGLDYPLPGRYSSKLQSHLEEEDCGKTVTVVHYGNYISVRVSGDVSHSLDLLGIIERMKERTGGEVSGGGHKQAASIKTTREKVNQTMAMFLSELGIGTG